MSNVRLVLGRSPQADLARQLMTRLPDFTGDAIRVVTRPGLRDRHGAVLAGSFLRTRVIALNCNRRELARIFTHELFHFVWLRLGNDKRLSYEDLMQSEFSTGARGELGWSAEWRKEALRPVDARSRTRRWREYCCESFCDSAACLYSGIRQHEEFTLSPRFRRRRAAWFARVAGMGPLSI